MTIYQQYSISQKAVEEASAAVLLTGNFLKVAVSDFLEHTGKIREIYTHTVENGSLVDGRIADVEGFTAELGAFFAGHHLERCSVRLVVDSPEFVSRVLKVPKGNRKKTEAYIRRYFGVADRLSAPIYAYETLETLEDSREARVLAAAVSAETITAYSDIFARLGMKLLSVDSAMLLSVRMLSRLPEVKGKSCIVHVTSGRESTGMMFVDGVFVGSMRNHLWEPFGSVGFGVEFARMNSQVLQSMRKEYPDAGIEAIYLCGLRDENMLLSAEAIRHMGETLPVSAPDGEAFIFADHQTTDSPSCFSEYFIPVAALAIRNADADYLRIGRDAQRKRLPPLQRGFITAACVIVLLLGLVCLWRGLTLRSLTLEQASLENEIAVLQDESSRVQTVAAELNYYRTRVAAIDELFILMNSYPAANSALNAVINSCSTFTDASGNEVRIANITVNSYDAAKGLLQFSVKAPFEAVGSINLLVSEFRKLGVFVSVDYSGYTQASDGDYIVNVICYLAEDAGK